VRGQEAMTLFQAMNTGHTTCSTMHADSVETAITRLESDPIDVPRALIQGLDMVAIQRLAQVDGQRVRRIETVAELDGIDQRSGDLAYSRAFTWDNTADSFHNMGSTLLESIRAERDWSQRDLRLELRARRAFLEGLLDAGITEYRQVTRHVHDYYADPESSLERLGVDPVDDRPPTASEATRATAPASDACSEPQSNDDSSRAAE
jgi:flagellar protein FlaI